MKKIKKFTISLKNLFLNDCLNAIVLDLTVKQSIANVFEMVRFVVMSVTVKTVKISSQIVRLLEMLPVWFADVSKVHV